ncbi:MAG: DUF6220 domain-containing protein [Anaerolineales bacterium]
MRKIARYIYVGFAWLTLVAVIIPFFIAGMSLFVSRTYWSAHGEIGFSSGFPILGLIIFGLIGWIPRRLTAWLIGMTLLHFVHTALPSVQEAAPMIAAVHPVSALLLVSVTYVHARRATQLLLQPSQEAESTEVQVSAEPSTQI